MLLPRTPQEKQLLVPMPGPAQDGRDATAVLLPPVAQAASSAMRVRIPERRRGSLRSQPRMTGAPSASAQAMAAAPSASSTPEEPAGRSLLVYHGRHFPGAQHAPEHAALRPFPSPVVASAGGTAASPGMAAAPAISALHVPPAPPHADEDRTPPIPHAGNTGSRKRPRSEGDPGVERGPSDTTKKILQQAGVPDRMVLQLPRELHLHMELHMRRALGLDEGPFRDIHERYRRAASVPCSAEAFYLSLQNMCDAARRAPGMRTDFIEMVASDGLMRRYAVALPRATPLVVLAQTVAGDQFGAMCVLERASHEHVGAACEVVRQRGLRLRMQDTLGYDYDPRLADVCGVYREDGGVNLSPEQLYQGLVSLCYRADGLPEVPRIELMHVDAQAAFSAGLKIYRIDRGLTVDGVRRYFVQLPEGKRFVVLARTHGDDPFGRVTLLYSPNAQRIEGVVKDMSSEVAIGWNAGTR